jgi:hypothetical protein
MRTLELTDDQHEHLARLADCANLSIQELVSAISEANELERIG